MAPRKMTRFEQLVIIAKMVYDACTPGDWVKIKPALHEWDRVALLWIMNIQTKKELEAARKRCRGSGPADDLAILKLSEIK